MTSLLRPVARRTTRPYSVLYTKPRRIVVKLLPSDELEFSEERRRVKYRICLATVFKYAVTTFGPYP